MLIPTAALSNLFCGPVAMRFSFVAAFVLAFGGVTMAIASIFSGLDATACTQLFPLNAAQLVWGIVFCFAALLPAVLSAFYKASFLQKHVRSATCGAPPLGK